MTAPKVGDLDGKFGKVMGDFFHSRRPWLVSKIADYVQMQSPSDHPVQLEKMAGLIEADLEGLGAELMEVPSVPRAVVAGFGRHAGASTALIFHHDTVWPIDGFPNARIEGDAWFAPGIFDMKANLPLVMLSLEYLAYHSPRSLDGLVFISSPDEEILGSVSSEFLPRLAKEFKLERALVFEPPGPGGALKQKRKGCARLEVTFRGIASHAGNHYERGKSALLAASRFLQHAESLTDLEMGLTVNVGRLSGGDAVNTRPAKAVMALDVRFHDQKHWQGVHAALNQYCDPEQVGIQVEVEAFLPPMDANHEEWLQLKKACEVSGCVFELGMAGGGSDGSRLADLGLKVMDGLGVPGGGEHAVHEHILMSELEPYFIRNTHLLLGMSGWGSPK